MVGSGRVVDGLGTGVSVLTAPAVPGSVRLVCSHRDGGLIISYKQLAPESARPATSSSAVAGDWKEPVTVSMCKLGHILPVAIVTCGDPWLSECFVISGRKAAG